MRRFCNVREPLVMTRNRMATPQVAKASVSSQPSMSCHAGRVKRKKLRGLLKMGSAGPPAAEGAYQKSARVDHSDIMTRPVRKETTIETASDRYRRTGATEKVTGLPAMRMA